MTTTALTVPGWRDHALSLVLDTLTSPHSKRAYGSALTRFFAWCEELQLPFARSTVQAYKAHLQRSGIKPQSLNVHLAAIRALAREAAENGLMEEPAAGAIERVRGEKHLGERAGNWLTLDQAKRLIAKPDPTKLTGLRDRALLALLIGCGLRRKEAATITIEQVQKRGNRWALIDVQGKGQKLRTIGMPGWAADLIWAWVSEAGLNSGPILRRVQYGKFARGPMSVDRIMAAVKTHAEACGFAIAPHDLRRTFAALSRKGGADMRQIQTALGHSSVTTTERYLGAVDSLEAPAADFIKIRRGDLV